MIVAIDTNCILPGRVGGIENYTLGLIEVLKGPDSPAKKLVLLTRHENESLFRPMADERTEVVLVERPTYRGEVITNWSALIDQHPADAPRALQVFQRHKADLLIHRRVSVVHFPGNTINPLDLDLPMVLNLHDLQHRHFPQYFSPSEIQNRQTWWNLSARRADALIAASNYVRDDLEAQLGVDRSRIFVTPDILQSAYFQPPAPAALAALRTRLELPSIFFIYPAAVWPHKNHERLIRAFASAGIAGAQLILTGGGQSESALPRLVEELGLRSRVRLLGRVETQDLIGLYHLATGLIFPSQYESWSIPVMEAMACGCPVACSNVTSLPEEVGDAGLLFAPGDEAAMTAAMRRLAADAAERRELARLGRERVQRYSAANFRDTLAQAYEHARSSHRQKKAA